jgi:transaldolase
MLTNRPKTKLLVDGGDPEETLRIKNLIGFVDGQTTNPSLIARNSEIQRRLASGQPLSAQEEKDAYKKIVQTISPLVGDAGVSIEVFADLDSRAMEMLAQGQEMFTWIPNAYVKYPCTHEGLRAAEMSVQKSIRVNMTLCFSQEQAAAVYAATRGSKEPVYVSPLSGDSTIKAKTAWTLSEISRKCTQAAMAMCMSWPQAYAPSTICFFPSL